MINSNTISDRCDVLSIKLWDSEPLSIHATSEAEALAMEGRFTVWVSLPCDKKAPYPRDIRSLNELDAIAEELLA